MAASYAVSLQLTTEKISRIGIILDVVLIVSSLALFPLVDYVFDHTLVINDECNYNEPITHVARKMKTILVMLLVEFVLFLSVHMILLKGAQQRNYSKVLYGFIGYSILFLADKIIPSVFCVLFLKGSVRDLMLFISFLISLVGLPNVCRIYSFTKELKIQIHNINNSPPDEIYQV